jgi:hypothetical protein
MVPVRPKPDPITFNVMRASPPNRGELGLKRSRTSRGSGKVLPTPVLLN